MSAPWVKCLPAFIRVKIESRHGLQAIIGNVGWLFIDRILRLSVGLFVGIWVARYLGPEQFGRLSYATAFVSLFSGIAVLGLDSIVVRELIHHPAKKEEILGSTFVLKLIGATVALLITVISIWQLRSQDELTKWLVGIIAAGMIFQAFDTVDLFFQSRLQAKYTVYAKNSAFLLIAGVKIALILNHADLIWFASAALAEVALGAAGLLLAYRHAGNRINALRLNWRLASTLLAASWPLLLSGTLVLATMNIDRIILGEIRGNHDVGLYSVANQLSTLWYMIPVFLGASVAPALTRSFAENRGAYFEKLQRVYSALTLVSLFSGCLIYFVSGPLVRLLFGASYEDAGEILAVHIWGSVFVFHVSIRTRALIIENRQKFVTIIAALTLVANIPLNISLVGLYGAVGAAYASLFSWMLCAAAFPLPWKETRHSAVMLYRSFFPFQVFIRKS